MDKDSYNTIITPGEGLFKDKGSKFLAFAFPIQSVEEAKEYLTKIRKGYHDARHHCYAYKLGVGTDSYRMNDDGEPSGTAGKPIYGQIISHDLSDILFVVVRYFGGTLLGTSGLINAYKMATINCIENSNVVERIVKKPLTLNYNYNLMSAVMKIVKDENIEVLEQDFTDTCRLRINIRLSEFERMSAKYSGIYGVTIGV